MNDKELLAELTKNCRGKEKKLMDLLKAFDLACLGYKMQEARCEDIYNRVLAENEFYAAKEAKRGGLSIEKQDRITDEKYTFLLSDEDFKRLQELVHPIMVADGITDEKGFYKENWCTARTYARKNLVEFLLTEIVPESMRSDLQSCRWNIVHSDKLINAFRPTSS